MSSKIKPIQIDLSTPEKQLEMLTLIVDYCLNGIQTEVVTPRGDVVTYTQISLKDAVAAIKVASSITGTGVSTREPINITVTSLDPNSTAYLTADDCDRDEWEQLTNKTN